jgi:hypothetical protein
MSSRIEYPAIGRQQLVCTGLYYFQLKNRANSLDKRFLRCQVARDRFEKDM